MPGAPVLDHNLDRGRDPTPLHGPSVGDLACNDDVVRGLGRNLLIRELGEDDTIFVPDAVSAAELFGFDDTLR